MRIIFYGIFSLLSIYVYAQPSFVGSLSSDGPQNGGTLFKINLPANSTSLIHNFNHFEPHRAESALTIGDADWLYGTLRYNGSNNHGALYRIKNDGTGFTVLYHMLNSFGPTTRPYFHTDGKIYFSDEMEMMSYDPLTNDVFAFANVPSMLTRNLHIDSDDWIYFVSQFGALEKIKTDGTNETILRNFTQNGDGFNGVAGITEIPGDSLIGTLTDGGALSGGIIYSIKKDGTGFTVLHSFESTQAFEPEGFNPESKLVYYDGRLFGTTTRGGNYDFGVVYKINVDGTGYHVVAHIPTGYTGRADQPIGDISITSDGHIIGAFYQFAQFSNGNARFFSVDTSGVDFMGFGAVNQYESGHFNNSPLLLNDQTILFTTQTMGRHDGGTVSEVSNFISTFNLYQFGASAVGFRPGELIKASDGRLYGLTRFGGPGGNGTIYSAMPDGTGYTKLHEFTDSEGYDPIGKLLEGSDGKLYGALSSGGPHGAGSLFRMDKNGTNFQVLYDFAVLADGYSPTGTLIEDAAGILYGTTQYGLSNVGVVFKINKDGTGYTVLKNFTVSELYYPYGGLHLSGTYLYGIGYQGGAFGNGGVFRIHTDGTGYQVLHSFSQSIDGAYPFWPPIVTISGKLYGATTYGGSSGMGTIYSMDISGANFQLVRDLAPGDAQLSQSPMILSSDGKLYGTGYASPGTAIFRLNTDGSGYSILKTFDPLVEGQIASSLVEVSSVALPVELTKFQAQKKDKKVLLSWETSSEVNSSSFEIEKSNDGKNFSKIGKVAASGTSNTIRSYSFSDDQPKNGVNFYRLKQFDQDGRFELSPIRSVVFAKAGSIVVYPNPSSDFINLQFESLKNQITIQIFNSEGSMIRSILRKQTELYQISVRDLPSGNYFIKVLADGEIYNERFIKN